MTRALPLVLLLAAGAALAGPLDAAKRAKRINEQHQGDLQEAVDGTAPEAAEERDAPLRQVRIVLAGPAAPVKPGTVPLSQRFENAGEAPVLLLRCLDGSAEGLRAPHVFLEVKDAGGTVLSMDPRTPRCGNLNQVREGDFFELKPGEPVDPFAGQGFSYHPLKLDRPGKYEVVLVYRLKEPFLTNPDLNGPASAKARELLPRLPRGEVRSNPVAVEVVGE